MKRLIIIGGGGHGRVVADIAALAGYDRIAFLDDSLCGDMPAPRLGPCEDFEKYLAGCEFIVAIGNSAVRRKFQERIVSADGRMASLVHPRAVIASGAVLGRGCVAAAGAVVNPGAKIGDGVIINTAATVDHDCEVGDFVHVAVGAHLCGTVRIGSDTWIGAGATVINNISICGGCLIGAGAVVVKNIETSGTYIGMPAKKLN